MKKNKVILICLIISLIAFLAICAYAAYIFLTTGKIAATTAKPIISVELQDANDDSKMNSYYNVIVKNYDNDGNVTETAFDYKIEIETTDGSDLPEYCWYDEAGNSLGTELTGDFSLTKSDVTYKIQFKNIGNEDITKTIKFNTVMTQKK